MVGVTGLDTDLVRPRWQPEPGPPNIPDLFTTNWLAFGVVDIQVDANPWEGHSDFGTGDDLLQEHQVDTVLCTFYGPNAGWYAGVLRSGLYVWQNRWALRANSVGLVEVTAIRKAPDYIQNQWVNRFDVDVILRREIRFNYAVRTLLQAQATIYNNPPATGIVIETDVLTPNIEPPAPTPYSENGASHG
jgi:hypothetical protein